MKTYVKINQFKIIRLLRWTPYFLSIFYSVLYYITVEICDIELSAFRNRIKLPSLLTLVSPDPVHELMFVLNLDKVYRQEGSCKRQPLLLLPLKYNSRVETQHMRHSAW